ncbi:MAG: RNA polymerase sporulation sigma factor SigH [Clostridia bacterium]|nr:RNA polymerase sporulation sigma factor SigH [Clostridia bacterium]
MEYYERTDEELVQLSRSGDEEATSLLLEKYKQLARSKASAYFMQGGDRDDIIQEGMIGVFKAIRCYEPEKDASFSTFAELCVKRQIISAVRGSSRQKHMVLNESMSLSKPVDSDNDGGSTLGETISDERVNDPESLMIMHESIDQIEKGCCDILSKLEREVWEMYMQGCSYSEIASRLDKTNKTVDNAIHRAKKKLAEWVEV